MCPYKVPQNQWSFRWLPRSTLESILYLLDTSGSCVFGHSTKLTKTNHFNRSTFFPERHRFFFCGIYPKTFGFLLCGCYSSNYCFCIWGKQPKTDYNFRSSIYSFGPSIYFWWNSTLRSFRHLNRSYSRKCCFCSVYRLPARFRCDCYWWSFHHSPNTCSCYRFCSSCSYNALDSRVIPNSIVSVDIEYTPKPVVSVVPDLKPVAPAIINSAELGDTSPLAVLVVSSPKPVASVEELELVTPVTSVEVIATPKAVSSVSIGTVPLPISTVAIETEPKPVLDVDPLIVEPMVPVATLEVVDISLFLAAPADSIYFWIVSRNASVTGRISICRVLPKTCRRIFRWRPLRNSNCSSGYGFQFQHHRYRNWNCPGTVPGTGPLYWWLCSIKTNSGWCSIRPKNVAEVEVLELAASYHSQSRSITAHHLCLVYCRSTT